MSARGTRRAAPATRRVRLSPTTRSPARSSPSPTNRLPPRDTARPRRPEPRPPARPLARAPRPSRQTPDARFADSRSSRRRARIGARSPFATAKRASARRASAGRASARPAGEAPPRRSLGPRASSGKGAAGAAGGSSALRLGLRHPSIVGALVVGTLKHELHAPRGVENAAASPGAPRDPVSRRGSRDWRGRTGAVARTHARGRRARPCCDDGLRPTGALARAFRCSTFFR